MSVKANVVVSQDGSGNFKTITEAVNGAPSDAQRYVIQIKAGTYTENIVTVKQNNITLIGDGIGKTVMQTSRNKIDGQEIYQSPNLVVEGNDFIAQDMSFQNIAGPTKNQAVALLCEGDRSVFYRCSFEGYQDTLYVNKGRQFYRECEISGTVDFIFGQLASTVFQKCTIKLRAPTGDQANVITAQGRTDIASNAAISIQDCSIINGEPCPADKCLDPQKTKTFLGRPWKAYSRTMIMQSSIDSLVDPAGWLAMDNNESTCTYREYGNKGPGADTSKRVKWPDYKAIDDLQEAMKYTVKSLIQGDQWLGATGVPFDEGLI